MIKKLFHIAIAGFLLNAGHLLAISSLLVEYNNDHSKNITKIYAKHIHVITSAEQLI